MKKVIRTILKWLTAPLIIPLFIAYGHILWFFDDDFQYRWAWEVPILEYLLGNERL